MTAVILENVTISFNQHPAVHHLSGIFAQGSLTAITGPNGGGKSTLLKGIAGLLSPSEGRIRLEPKGRTAYLPQSAALLRDIPMTALQLVATGFWHRAGGMKALTQSMQAKASEALEAVRLGGFETRDISSLSAGQLQRALFARAQVQDASLILLDEPFSAVDTETTHLLLHRIEDWHKEGRTILCILHDFEQIRQHFPACLLLARECLAWGTSPEVLHSEHQLHAHGFREDWGTDICEIAS